MKNKSCYIMWGLCICLYATKKECVWPALLKHSYEIIYGLLLHWENNAETSNCICKSEGEGFITQFFRDWLSLAKRFKRKQWSQFIQPLFVLNLEVFKRNVYFLSTFVWPVVWNKKPGITKSIFVYQFTLSRQLFFPTFPFICVYSYLFSN